MDTYDFVHLALLAMGSDIKGKTKLQKTVYFLGVLTGMIDELGYRPHFYGPYSDDVAGGIGRLRALRFVDQNVTGMGTVDQSGFEVYRYDYRLNDDGRKVAQQKAKRHREAWERIQQAAQMLKHGGDLDYMKLSVAAKAFFMLGEKKGRASIEDLTLLAKRFGWSVTNDQIKEAAGYLERLGLVENV
ncbi:MAG TPA: hypothetical protein PKK06_17430 [Phycisphaerae bacterium]|nr:hypothetical protein [Phycisphaerae bacterium]HNU46957.1 hypothetical protein [Phycisphaerae bacterium]